MYGPATVDAVEALQKAHGLPGTGTVDKATAAALQGDLSAKGGAAAQRGVASTSAVQQVLKLAGFWDGPVDGEWTPELTEALQEFQKELGVKPTGNVDAATVAALEKAIAEGQREPSESTSAHRPPRRPARSRASRRRARRRDERGCGRSEAPAGRRSCSAPRSGGWAASAECDGGPEPGASR